jgi:hypothetical protein
MQIRLFENVMARLRVAGVFASRSYFVDLIVAKLLGAGFDAPLTLIVFSTLIMPANSNSRGIPSRFWGDRSFLNDAEYAPFANIAVNALVSEQLSTGLDHRYRQSWHLFRWAHLQKDSIKVSI